MIMANYARSVFHRVVVFSFGISVSAFSYAAVSNQVVTGQRSFRFGISDIRGSFSTSESRYTITGIYAETSDVNAPGENDPNNVRVIASYEWVASGQFTLNGGTTAETLEFYSPGERTFAGSLTSTMVCKNGDPWREAKGPCERVVSTPNWQTAINFRNDLGATAAGVPFSSVLTVTERGRLNQQYQVFLASRGRFKPGTGNLQMENSAIGKSYTPPSQAGSTTAAFSKAPAIVYPGGNNPVIAIGKLVVQLAPPKYAQANTAAVEFTWLDTSPASKTYVTTITASMAEFRKGVVIPENYFRNQIGQWKLRAAIINPALNTWSPEIKFRLAFTNPAFTTRQKGLSDFQRR